MRMTFNWFVGFYEGEGHPTWNCSGVRGSRKYLRLIVVQKERAILEKAKRFLSSTGTVAYVWPRRHDSSWMLVVGAPHAKNLARKMIVLMCSNVKKQQLKKAVRKYH